MGAIRNQQQAADIYETPDATCSEAAARYQPLSRLGHLRDTSQLQNADIASTYQHLDALNGEAPTPYQCLSTSDQKNASKATYVNAAH